MMINLIFDRLDIPNKKNVFVYQTEKDNLSWKNIFNILSRHIQLPLNYIQLQCDGKYFNGLDITDLQPFQIDNFMKKENNFVLFHVKISRPKIRQMYV